MAWAEEYIFKEGDTFKCYLCRKEFPTHQKCASHLASIHFDQVCQAKGEKMVDVPCIGCGKTIKRRCKMNGDVPIRDDRTSFCTFQCYHEYRRIKAMAKQLKVKNEAEEREKALREAKKRNREIYKRETAERRAETAELQYGQDVPTQANPQTFDWAKAFAMIKW